jgi:hypothetical protein
VVKHRCLTTPAERHGRFGVGGLQGEEFAPGTEG